ncbi:MAG: DUF4093 domain-containing protein [Ruminococcus sp.]|nr:DUF4093 domain-containing protein [Ruminococcus sp.]
MEKIRLKQAIVVEGKYDKIKVSSFVDATVITTDGFGIYSSPETARLIRFYAKTVGIVILTDSDRAGMQIRGRIKSLADGGNVVNVYVPEIFGKERRKTRPSKEGKLGVEGMEIGTLRKAFEDAGLLEEAPQPREPVTKTDFIDLGLSGAPDSSALRERLAKSLGLPVKMSSAALRDAVSARFGREDFFAYFSKFIKEQDQW